MNYIPLFPHDMPIIHVYIYINMYMYIYTSKYMYNINNHE